MKSPMSMGWSGTVLCGLLWAGSPARAVVYEANGWRIEKTLQYQGATELNYVIQVQRLGPDAGVVSITDTRDPAGTTGYGEMSTPPAFGGGGSASASWTQQMSQGSTHSVFVTTLLAPGLPPGTCVSNTASVTDGGGTTSVRLDTWVGRPNDTTRAHGSAGVGADPVNTWTGEYLLEPIVDFDLGGPLPLRFVRWYASRLDDPGTDLVRSALGPGWMHTFDVQLVRQRPGSADRSFFVLLEGGKVVPFAALADGTWALNLASPFARYELKSDGKDLWFCDPSRDLLYRFEEADRSGVKEIADRNGNALLIGRRADGLATNVADGLGRELRLEYDAAGRLARVTDGTRSVSFGHNATGLLVAATNAMGQATAYAYDPANSLTNGNGALLASVRLPRGNTPLVQAYGPEGRVVLQTDACGGAMSFDYGTNRVTTILGPDGTESRHQYSAKGALYRAYDACSNYFQYTFGLDLGRDRLTTLVDRRGKTSRAYFDAEGGRKPTSSHDRTLFLTRYAYATNAQVFTNRESPARTVAFDFLDLAFVTNANLSVERFLRDARGNMTGRVDRAGDTWTMTCNARGQRVSTVHPGGGEQTRAYHADGTLASVSDSEAGTTLYAYDALRRSVGITHPDGAVEGWQLDALDRVTAFTNAAGGVTRYERDANGRVTRTTDPLGYETAVELDLLDRVTNRADSVGLLAVTTYDAAGRPATVADAAGTNAYRYDRRGWLTNAVRGARSWNWRHDPEGNVTQVVSSLGRARGYAFDNVGRVATARDPLYPEHLRESRWFYDRMGMPESFRDVLMQTTRFGHDAASRLSAVTNAAGAFARFEYGPGGVVARITDCDGRAEAFGYTPMGRLAAVTNALGEVARFEYDAAGRLARTVFADGARVDYAYDAAGRVKTVTDEGGHAWRFGYDARGDVVAVTNPAGGVTSYAYNIDGTLRSFSDSDTGPVERRYDAARRLVEAVRPGGATYRYAYNEHREITGRTDALGRTTAYTYDADGRMVAVTDPDTHATTFAHDAAGRLTNVTDRTGGAVSLEYDFAGNLAAATDATGVRIGLTRDPMGRVVARSQGAASWAFDRDRSGFVTAIRTPSGRLAAFELDALHRVARITNALGGVTSFERDARGRVTAVTDPAGRATRAAYDPRGLPVSIALPDSNAVAYAWNALGRLERLTDGNGSAWTFAYTPMGRLQTATDPLLRATQHAYDADGRPATVVFPGGGSVTYTRDGNGALIRARYSDGPDLEFRRDAAGAITNANDVVLHRDAEGRVVGTEHLGVVCGAAYDAAGRLASVSCDNGAFTVAYAYATGPGGHGRLTRVSDTLTGTQVDFAYDADLRLRTVTLPNGEVITSTWDDADRLTRLQSGGHVDVAVSYDPSGRVTDADTVAPLTPSGRVATAIATLTYDAASQIASPGYAHDARGRVTATPQRAFAWDGASRLVGVGGVTLTYDGLGQVRARADGASARRFHSNLAIGGAPIVAEKDAATGAALRHYVWTPGGRLLYMIDAAHGNAVYFYHFDPTGNTLALTDAGRNVVAAYTYDPYGRILARTGVVEQPFTFSGAWGVRQEGAEGTLYHMGARYYDATIGRFLSPEPLWPLLDSPKQLNPYQYAGGDPIRYVDPSGLFFGMGAETEEELEEIDSAFMKLAEQIYLLSALGAYEEAGVIGMIQAMQQRGFLLDLFNDPQAQVHFRNIVAWIHQEQRRRFQARKEEWLKKEGKSCPEEARSSQPQNPPDLGQRLGSDPVGPAAVYDQLTPYQPGVASTPSVPPVPYQLERFAASVPGGQLLTGYTSADIVTGLFDPTLAWEAGVREHLRRSATKLAEPPPPDPAFADRAQVRRIVRAEMERRFAEAWAKAMEDNRRLPRGHKIFIPTARISWEGGQLRFEDMFKAPETEAERQEAELFNRVQDLIDYATRHSLPMPAEARLANERTR